MNGGAWLTLDGGFAVDVLLRDLTVVEHWIAEAQLGRFAIDGLPGYVAGIPTYSLMAEASIAQPLRGRLSLPTEFPGALAVSGAAVWRWNRDFSLRYVEMHARRGNAVALIGQASRAVLEEAHARCSAGRRWVLNEKHLVEAADLQVASRALADVAAAAAAGDDALHTAIGVLRRTLGA
jgi:hypothetical protein